MAEEYKQTFEDQMKEEILKLPKEAKVRAVALNNLQNKKKDLDEQLEKEIKELERKYELLSLPIYQQSSQIITGARLPNEEELATLDEFLNEDEKQLDKNTLIDIPENHKPIEGYWLKVFKNSDQLVNEVSETDDEILKHLINIEYLRTENKQDFTLTFTFEENEFFTNDKLIKTFFFNEDEEEHYKTECTQINWKEGKDITKKLITKKQKNKKSGQQRTITKEVEADTFFCFFQSLELKTEMENDEEEQVLLEKMNKESDIAQALVEEIIPFSLEYYLGIKVDEEDEDFQDEDDEDLEGDDDDESPKAVKSKKKNQKGSHKASNETPKEECKQQ